MEITDKLEKIMHFTPEFPGYEGGEKSRETDKTVRLHLTSELNHLRREFSKGIRESVEKRKAAYLPVIDQTLYRMEHLANTVKYASRSYRDFFEHHKPAPKTLDSLYTFDLKLFQQVKSLKILSEKLAGEDPSQTTFKDLLEELNGLVDSMKKIYFLRHEIMANGKG